MATAEYIIQTEHTSGNTAKHYHGVSISTLNSWAANNIPKNAIVTSIRVLYDGKCSLGDTYVYVGFSKSSSEEPGDELINAQLKTSSQGGWTGWIGNYSSTYPFNINTSYSTLSVYMNSGILYKKFTCYYFKVLYDYYIPTYTITVKAGTGGTVSGGGTFEAGKTATITATASTGYTFKQWNDGNTDASRTVSVNGNATYTAEFTPKEYQITVECISSESGKKCTVSGAGTYKYGDTVTLTATNIPNYHKISGWGYTANNLSIPDGYLGIGDDSSILQVILTEENITGFSADLTTNFQFIVNLEHTGFTVKVNVSPDNSLGSVMYGEWVNGVGYSDTDYVLANGFTVKYKSKDIVGIRAISNEGYRFVKWENGDTANPRQLSVSGDTTYTAIFEKIPPRFISANMVYMNDQISRFNKVIHNEGFIISVEIT
jgi:hypothetical protein